MKVVLLSGSKAEIASIHKKYRRHRESYIKNGGNSKDEAIFITSLDEENVFSSAMTDLISTGLLEKISNGYISFSGEQLLFELENRADGVCRLTVSGATANRLLNTSSHNLKGSTYEPASIEEWNELWSSLKAIVDATQLKPANDAKCELNSNVKIQDFVFHSAEELIQRLSA
mgnify:CR=1 FL=1|tara:strand:+ start:250 stop:768 length:519 start_codon:yes stop_codon:yes gene_type:complete